MWSYLMSICGIFDYNIVKNMKCTKDGRIKPMGLIISPISMSSHSVRRAFLLSFTLLEVALSSSTPSRLCSQTSAGPALPSFMCRHPLCASSSVNVNAPLWRDEHAKCVWC